MASFIENPQQYSFNPFIDTLASDSLIRVEMEKQRQFDMGVQKIQSYVDSTLNLPIAKAETQEYVKGKLSQLKQHLSTSVTGDFSDGRLINQIGGLTSRIANDPIIQNGVQASVQHQNYIKQMEEDRKSGKLQANNQQLYLKKFNRWLNDGQNNTVLDASYTTGVNIIKEGVDLYNKMSLDPSQNITEDAFRIGADGKSIEINPTLKEGVSPERIQAVSNLLFSRPDVQQQLYIDAEATYGDMPPEQVYKGLTETAQSTLNDIDAAIGELKTSIATDKTIDKKQAVQQIENLKKQAAQLQDRHSRYTQLLGTNPLAAGAALIQEQITGNFIKAYATEKSVKNPMWEVMMAQEQLALTKEELTWKKGLEKYKAETDRMKAAADSAEAEKGAKGISTTVNPRPVDTEQVLNNATSASMYEKQATARSVFANKQIAEFSAMAPGMDLPIPYIQKNGQWVPNTQWFMREKGMTEQEALKAVDDTMAQIAVGLQTGKAKGVLPQKAAEVKNSLDRVWDNYQNISFKIKEIEEDFKPQMDKIKSIAGNSDLADAYIVNKKYPGWENVERSLQKKYGKNWKEAVGLEITYEGNRGETVTRPGKNVGEYRRVANLIDKNTDLQKAVIDREEAFKNAQRSLENKEIGFLFENSNARNMMNDRFSQALSNITDATQRERGEYKDLLKLTDRSDKQYENNGYYAYQDFNTGEYKIGISRNGEKKEVSVSAETYFSIPGVQVNNQFQDMYGDRLSLTNGLSTDVEGQGRKTSYTADQPINSPFIVQYHLYQGSTPNTYNIKVWVDDTRTEDKKPVNRINGDFFTPIGGEKALTPAQVLEIQKSLSDPTLIDQYLHYTGYISE